MLKRRIHSLRLALLLVLLFGITRPDLQAADPIKIGVVNSVFRDVPEMSVKIVLKKFTELIQSQTGMNVEIQVAGDFAALSDDLAKGKYCLAVFHGHEFAWAREKVTDLQPVLIAVNRQSELHAHLVVRKASPLTPVMGVKGLEGKVLAQPWRCREFARLYVRRRCLECNKLPEQLFKTITEPCCAEEALDMVFDGTADVAIVDGVALNTYSQVKRARFADLQTLFSSETFPASVLACRKDALAPKELKLFREGMINANSCKKGQDLLKWTQLTSFEAIPDNYELLLGQILKAYPAPEEPVKK
jgi:ABC-type phosphate/phosphonate transport system substrate-binding protein